MCIYAKLKSMLHRARASKVDRAARWRDAGHDDEPPTPPIQGLAGGEARAGRTLLLYSPMSNQKHQWNQQVNGLGLCHIMCALTF
jgi:hypothetical protein